MKKTQPKPGVSRKQRISAEGLQRLEKQLLHGAAINPQIFSQWIKRFGEPARDLLRQYGKYSSTLEE